MKRIHLYFIVVTALTSLISFSAQVHAMSKPKNPTLANSSMLPTIQYRDFDTTKSLGLDAWRGLDHVTISDPTLAFSDRWVREYRHEMTDSDEKRIRSKYTASLKEVLEKAFAEKGWKVVDQAGPNTLVVQPSLSDLRIQAPDLSHRPRTKDFVEHVGSSRLTLTFSTQDRGIIGQLEDHDRTRNWGSLGDLKPTNRVVNLRDFKFLFKKWAKRAAHFTEKMGSPESVSAY